MLIAAYPLQTGQCVMLPRLYIYFSIIPRKHSPPPSSWTELKYSGCYSAMDKYQITHYTQRGTEIFREHSLVFAMGLLRLFILNTGDGHETDVSCPAPYCLANNDFFKK